VWIEYDTHIGELRIAIVSYSDCIAMVHFVKEYFAHEPGRFLK